MEGRKTNPEADSCGCSSILIWDVFNNPEPFSMDIAIYSDNTVPLQLNNTVVMLNERCDFVRFHFHPNSFHLKDGVIVHPRTHKALPTALRKQFSEYDINILATSVPYQTIIS